MWIRVSSRPKELCLCVGSKHPFDTARGSEIGSVYANIHGHTDTFWNHYNRSHSSFHVLCLSSRFWGGCGDQCLGSQKKVIHRNPLLVRGSHASCTSCCLLNGLCIPHLKQPTFLLLFFIQDGSRGSGSGEEGRVQPPVRHLGSRHYRH